MSDNTPDNNIKDMQPGPEMDRVIMQTIFKASKKYHGEEECWFHFDENGDPDYEWPSNYRPSTDIVAAMEVEDEACATQGSACIYVRNIIEVMNLGSDRGLSTLAKLIRATPEQRCKAALLAMNGGSTE